MQNAYVVSVFDGGLERNFICSFAMLSADGIFMVCEGIEHRYSTSDLISIESVKHVIDEHILA